MKRLWFLLLAISLGANAGFAVVWLSGPRQHAPGPPGPGPGPRPAPPAIERVLDNHLDRMSEGLLLTGDQRARLADGYKVLFPRILDQNRAVAQLRRKVHESYGADSVDAPGFRELVARLSHEQAKLDSLVAEAMLQEAAVMTTEQRRRYIPGMPWTRAVQTAQGQPEVGPGPGPGPRGRRMPGPGFGPGPGGPPEPGYPPPGGPPPGGPPGPPPDGPPPGGTP